MKKIIVYGGSFSPVHFGHLEIAKKALNFLHADKCLFVPTLNPRFKSAPIDAKFRVEMLELMLENEKRLEINLEEILAKEKVNYTYETLLKIQKKEVGEYYLLIGLDQVNRLDEWYKIDELSKICQIVAYKRKNYPLNMDIIKKYNIKLLEGELFDISSTDIRNLKKLYTKKSILDYIINNNLYYVEKIKLYLDDKRFKHSESVANLSFNIAKNNNLDPYLAYQAGLLHDIAKNLNKAEARMLMEKYYQEYLDLEEFTYHQFLAIHILKNDFHLDNEMLFEAIKFHCTGNNNLSPYAKIIYAADKIEPLRNYDSSDLIDLCLKDINLGFKEVLKANRKYLNEKYNVEEDRLMLNCYNYYL